MRTKEAAEETNLKAMETNKKRNIGARYISKRAAEIAGLDEGGNGRDSFEGTEGGLEARAGKTVESIDFHLPLGSSSRKPSRRQPAAPCWHMA